MSVQIAPEVFLAFKPSLDLKNLNPECVAIQQILRGGGCAPYLAMNLENASDFETFYRGGSKNLMFFHYGGHANDKGLAHKEDDGTERIIMTYDILTKYMDAFENLKLVFLNACNSEAAAQFFLKKADVLICTRTPVDDNFAFNFAQKFYANMLSNNDLASVFQATQNFMTLKNGRGMGDFVRGAMREEDSESPVTPSVFEIKYRDNNLDLGKSTFNAWRQLIQPPQMLTQPKETTASAQNIGFQSNAYLLCNRKQQVRAFNSGLTTKTEEKRPEPIFVFIHDVQKHCPPELFKRFVDFTLKEDWATNRTPIKIELPIDDIEEGRLEKAKIKLLENYCRMGLGEQKATGEWDLIQRMPDNDYIVVHHDLSNGDWAEEWTTFLTFYINELSQKLATKLSQKLIVVITRTNIGVNDGFVPCFQKFADDATKLIVNLTGFAKINNSDITKWIGTVFQETKFESSEIIGEEEEKFFLEIKDLLKQKLGV